MLAIIFIASVASYFVYLFFSGNVPQEILVDGSIDYNLIVPWAKTLPEQMFEALSKQILSNPIIAILYFVMIAFSLILIALLLKFFSRIMLFLHEAASRKDLLNKTGLFEFWPNASITERAPQWAVMADRILASPHTTFNLLGATGWDTFGHSNSPLHKAMENFSGSIRVILMNPDSHRLPARAMSIGMTTAAYKHQIKKSIKFLKELKAKGHFVELKLYGSTPNWKMIFTPRRVWLQHYHNDHHVADCPVYMFYSTQERTGLYQSFAKDFERIWAQCDFMVDLSTN